MKWKQVFVGGIFSGIAIILIDMIFSCFTQTIWEYNVFELPGMRTIEDPVAILFFVYPWVLGFAMTYVYPYIGKVLEGDSIVKGWKFGLMMWVVVSITSAFLVFTSMNYPIGFTINSVVGPLIYMPVSGIVIAKTFDWIK